MGRQAPLGSTSFFLAVLLLWLMSMPSIAQTPAMDITEVEILVEVSRVNGALVPSPYNIEINVQGSNIKSIGVQSPKGVPLNPLEGDEEWRYISDEFDFTSLAMMSDDIGFGEFAFTFTALDDSVETVNVTFDPGSVDPHPGYAEFTFPINNQTDVNLHPTLTWTCANGPCGNFYAWYLVAPIEGIGNEYEDDIRDPNVTSWCPGELSENILYEFSVFAGTILGGIVQMLETEQSQDGFIYAPGFESSNEITFETEAVLGLNPGRVPTTMLVQRISPTELELSWSASTCGGSQDYGIYQGVIGDWYSHVKIDCQDDGAVLTEIVPIPAGNAYYLVIPLNGGNEGSYGLDSSSCERPPATAVEACRALQALGCP